MSDINELEEMAAEPLLPELEESITDGPLGPMIANEFCHSVVFLPGLANRQYEQNKKSAYDSLAKGDWEGWVFRHERPYRTNALLHLIHHGHTSLLDRLFCKTARQTWMDCENICQHLEDWEWIFKNTDGNLWMDEEERVTLNALSDRIKVYRGVCNDLGVSWSLSFEVAKFFANRQMNESTGIVRVGWVHRRDVFAYLSTRGEKELIVLDPDKVHLSKGIVVGLPDNTN